MVEESGSIKGMDITNKLYTGTYDIQVSGTTPRGGYLTYENNLLKDGCLTMDNYKITIENGEVKDAEAGQCESVSLTACDSSNFNPSPESWFNFDATTGSITGFSESWDGTTDITIPCQIGEIDVVDVKGGAFAGKGLTSVIINDNVVTINGGAFSNNKLTQLILGNSVATIGSGAFAGGQLTELVIGNSVITIESGAFNNNQLTELTLGNSVATIGDGAFGVNQLTKVTIPNSVTTIGSSAFLKFEPRSNPNLTTIYNDSGKSFDWGLIINGTSDGKTYEEVTVENQAGNVVIKKSN